MVKAETHSKQMSFSLDLDDIAFLEDDVALGDAGDGHETLKGRDAHERS
jgi:hypothetical protein